MTKVNKECVCTGVLMLCHLVVWQDLRALINFGDGKFSCGHELDTLQILFHFLTYPLVHRENARESNLCKQGSKQQEYLHIHTIYINKKCKRK